MMNTGITLTRHKLRHIPAMKVDESIFSTTFRQECAVRNCDARCCAKGVFLDIAERDQILAHADLVRRHMEPAQEHDSSRWFEPNGHDDADFPSGQAVGTEVYNGACVFLMHDGRCVLHTAAAAELPNQTDLKPFFCFAYPITISNAVLMVDKPDFVDRPQCCTGVPDGTRHALDVCREELVFVLGEEGFAELQEHAQDGLTAGGDKDLHSVRT